MAKIPVDQATPAIKSLNGRAYSKARRNRPDKLQGFIGGGVGANQNSPVAIELSVTLKECLGHGDGGPRAPGAEMVTENRILRGPQLPADRAPGQNRDLGYDRIAGALANLGYEICEQHPACRARGAPSRARPKTKRPPKTNRPPPPEAGEKPVIGPPPGHSPPADRRRGDGRRPRNPPRRPADRAPAATGSPATPGP
jgi:hypothetical protein